MNKTIRRSIVIAAGVSGAWALGSAVASADELPVHSVSVPDRPSASAADAGTADAHGTAAQVGDVTGAAHTVVGRVAQTVDTTAGHVARNAHTTVGRTAQTAHTVAGHPAQGAGAAADRTVHAAQGTAGSTLPHAGGAATQAEGTHAVATRAGGTVAQTGHGAVAHAPEAVQGQIDYLFGPLSSFAPELAAQTPRTAHTAEAAAPVARTAPATARTTAAPAAQPPGLPGASGVTDTVNQVVGTVTHLPPASDAVTDLTDLAVALHDNLPDPAAPGSPSYTALRVVGDAAYIAEGIDGDVSSGRLPDNVPQDTARLVQDTVDGLGGQSLGGRTTDGR